MGARGQERAIRLVESIDFGAALGDRSLVASSVAHDGALWLLGLDGMRYAEQGRFRFPTSAARRDQIHIAVRLDGRERGGVEQRMVLAGRRNLHHVQPMPGGRLLVSCARCYEEADGSPERNAVILGRDGAIEAEMVLGDAIADLQATEEGILWASYFDEGTGTRGAGEFDPVGASGLVAFDRAGNKLFTFDPEAAGTRDIVDCYALNVASSAETWIYFYSELALVRLSLTGPPRAWATGVAGARAIAVGEGHVLLDRGYDANHRYVLCRLGDRALEPVAAFVFIDEAGELLGPAAHGRGPCLHFIRGARWYRAEIGTLLKESG